MAVTSIICVENLQKCYGGTEAVRDITLQIFRGEFFGLLGPNGAGKTTTIGMLTGLIRPTGGRILIAGFDLFSNSGESKAKVGLVPQSFALYPTLCARDNLNFFGRIYGLRGRRLKERILQALKIVALRDRADQTVSTFSNGMKRRLNIAAALLHEPEILILDEPTSGLDPLEQEKIRSLIKKLKKTIIFSTHILSEVEDVANKLVIINNGKVVYDGKKPKGKGAVEKLFKKLVK